MVFVGSLYVVWVLFVVCFNWDEYLMIIFIFCDFSSELLFFVLLMVEDCLVMMMWVSFLCRVCYCVSEIFYLLFVLFCIVNVKCEVWLWSFCVDSF